MIDGVGVPCEECGFDPESAAPDELPDAVRALSRRYSIPLSRFLAGEDGDAIVRQRPAPDVWSALEYACHVRDVLSLFDGRIHRALDETDPELDSWDQDGAAVTDGYNEQDPAGVADALAANAETLATTLQLVPGGGWERTAVRAGDQLTVLEMGRYALHEGHHHLLDVGRSLRTARGR